MVTFAGRRFRGQALQRSGEGFRIEIQVRPHASGWKSIADFRRYGNVEPDFGKALANCLLQVRRGRVATCGAIARALGDIRAARSVATWLVTHPNTPRGHRVVRANGRPVLSSTIAELADEGVRLVHGRVPSERMLDSFEPVDFLKALREEQRRLSEQVLEADRPGKVERIAGVDAAYEGDVAHVAAVCLDAEELTPLEIATVRREARFPYIPTYLGYREYPGIEAAVHRLAQRPDVLMVDGHGRLHPVLFGIACYAGVQLNLPTIGVAKHRLVGRVVRSRRRNSEASPVEFRGSVRGFAWIPPGRGRPIFVSVGNRVSLERALDLVRGATRQGYPEPMKLADRICREMKRNEKREKGATQ